MAVASPWVEFGAERDTWVVDTLSVQEVIRTFCGPAAAVDGAHSRNPFCTSPSGKSVCGQKHLGHRVEGTTPC